MNVIASFLQAPQRPGTVWEELQAGALSAEQADMLVRLFSQQTRVQPRTAGDDGGLMPSNDRHRFLC